MAWIRLFHPQEPVYKELCVEFLDIVYFTKKKGVNDRKNITFFLGGERRELSLVDFAMRTNLYLPYEVYSESYIEFIFQCLTLNEEFKEANYWPSIANRVYQNRDNPRK
ncbi:unnamed protein product [Lactuca saligna]|uniref:Uncharacterized protein n=1 Tax=Lactuca saligna TaxID=75948 RepID=A0AA36E211_LACSI|nr:unnamed protein product [Lactuca saligna]